MDYMFWKAVSFNQMLNSWNVSTTNMHSMFYYTRLYFNESLPKWYNKN